MNNESIINTSLLEFDDSEIKTGDIVLLSADFIPLEGVKSVNNIVRIHSVSKNPNEFDKHRKEYIFEGKDNKLVSIYLKRSQPLSKIKKIKTYSHSKINHKPGDLFFSLEELTDIRKKNIVYEEILRIDKTIEQNKVFYKSEDGYQYSISRLETVVFINVDNNLNIIEDEYKKNNQYLNIVKSMQEKQGLTYG